MPPEYVQYGRISLKTDVYSFGIVILEIISGRKNGYLDDCKSSPSLGSYVSDFFYQHLSSMHRTENL